MKDYYSKLSPERFKIISIGFMLFGDLLLCRWLWARFIENPKIQVFINSAVNLLIQQRQFSRADLPPDFQKSIFELMEKSLLLMFAFILFFHLINYAAYWKDKMAAFYYLRLMVWVGTFGALSAGISSLNMGLLGYLIILLSMMYLFVAIGFIYFPIKKVRTENPE